MKMLGTLTAILCASSLAPFAAFGQERSEDMANAAPVAAGGPACAAHDPVPSRMRNGMDYYPRKALLRQEEGQVGIEVDIDAEGKPVACRVTISSANDLLDQHTCEKVMRDARFEPAQNEQCRPVPGVFATVFTYSVK